MLSGGYPETDESASDELDAHLPAIDLDDPSVRRLARLHQSRRSSIDLERQVPADRNTPLLDEEPAASLAVLEQHPVGAAVEKLPFRSERRAPLGKQEPHVQKVDELVI